jgi:hypothetical protein
MRLTELEFRAEHAARPGLVPVSLDARHRTAVWVDLNGFHCSEGSFRRSMAVYAALRAPSEAWQCNTSLDFLNVPPNPANCIAPTGFILHAGRCGSTLLAKVLARCTQHMVFGEGGPHNQIWHLPAAAPTLLRNLVLHTARRRLPNYLAHIVKFTSFNVLHWDGIKTAFPGVPTLFLFRDPARILASYRRLTPGWMGTDIGGGTRLESAEQAVKRYFQAAILAGNELACFDYADLTPARLPSILRFFNLEPSQADVALMEAEFTWDAKANRPWLLPSAAEPDQSPALAELYGELRARRVRW